MNREHMESMIAKAKEHNCKPLAIYRVGSHNYGVNTPESDLDYKMVVLPNLYDILDGKKIAWSFESEEFDYTAHSVFDFHNHMFKGNLNFTEFLFTKGAIKILDPDMEMYLDELRNIFISPMFVQQLRLTAYKTAKQKLKTYRAHAVKGDWNTSRLAKELAHTYRLMTFARNTEDVIDLGCFDRDEFFEIKNHNRDHLVAVANDIEFVMGAENFIDDHLLNDVQLKTIASVRDAMRMKLQKTMIGLLKEDF